MQKYLFAIFLAIISTSSYARDQISIVGSSTVYPFATTVAEKFGQLGSNKTPVIESTGSGGGMKIFCKGIGVNTPDLTNASRAIKPKEAKMCADAGITPIERLIGYDGITISSSKEGTQYSLTKEEIFLAVAAQIPDGNGGWKANDHASWSDINPDLPNKKIDIMIPPTTSGTRDAFVELIMHEVCKKNYGMAKKEYKARCHAVRTDNQHVVQMGENDNLIIEKLLNDPDRLGVFGFSFLDQNRDRVHASIIDGVLPEFETIAAGSYGVSRPLYYYIKKEHIGIIPGIEEFDAMFLKMSEPDGPLVEQGLIPLSK